MINQAAANAILNLILQGIEWPGVARNDSPPLANLYFALHTADPGPTGNQSTSEVAYTGYARTPVPRSVQGWALAAGGSASPLNNVAFAAGTGGFAIATFASIGTSPSGAGEIIFSGPLSPAIVCGNNVTPVIEDISSILLT